MTEPRRNNRSHPLRGRELRPAALVVLKRWGPGSISQIIDALDDPNQAPHTGAIRQAWTNPPRYAHARDRVRWANNIPVHKAKLRAQWEHFTLPRLQQGPNPQHA